MNKIIVNDKGQVTYNGDAINLGEKNNEFFEELVEKRLKNDLVIEVNSNCTHINGVLFSSLEKELEDGSQFRQTLDNLKKEQTELEESIEIDETDEQ